MPDINPKATRKNSLAWSDIKSKLVDFDHAALVRLARVLYVASTPYQ